MLRDCGHGQGGARCRLVPVNPVTFLAVSRRTAGDSRVFVLWLTDRHGRFSYRCSMSAKYYTQFLLTDAQYHGGNEFSGVVELSRPMDGDCEVEDIEAVLARNFDLQLDAVRLVSWSRLH